MPTGWPIRLITSFCWDQNKSSVTVYTPFTETLLSIWCQQKLVINLTGHPVGGKVAYPKAFPLGVVHVVEPDGEALRAEPDGLHALPLGPRREESESSAVPNWRGQILADINSKILRCDTQLNISPDFWTVIQGGPSGCTLILLTCN